MYPFWIIGGAVQTSMSFYRKTAAAHMDATPCESRALGACRSTPWWELWQAWSEFVCTDCALVHSYPARASTVHVGGAANPWRNHASANLRKPWHSYDIFSCQLCFNGPLVRQLLRHQREPLRSIINSSLLLIEGYYWIWDIPLVCNLLTFESKKLWRSRRDQCQ